MASIRDTNSDTGDATSITATVPTHEDGDLLLLFIHLDRNTTITTPTGWTLRHNGVGDDTLDDCRTAVYEREADSEPASYSITLSIGEDFCWAMLAIQDHDGINQSAMTSEQDRADTVLCPSVTTTVDGCLILRVAGFDGSVSFVIPSGTTSVYSEDEGSCSAGCGSATQATAGATGTAEFTGNTANEQWVTVTIAIAPAVVETAVAGKLVGNQPLKSKVGGSLA